MIIAPYQTIGRESGVRRIMSRAQRVVDDTAVEGMVDAAAACFYRHGYTGTRMRSIAAEANVSVGRLYGSFPCKQALLAEIVNATYDGLLVQTQAAVAVAGEHPAARLEAAVWAQCDYYAAHRCTSFVANVEVRGLEPENRERAAAKRRRLNDIVAEIISEGIEQGVFDVEEPAAVSRALLSMCTAVASWEEVSANDAPRHIARTYCGLAERMTAPRLPVDGRVGASSAPPLALGIRS